MNFVPKCAIVAAVAALALATPAAAQTKVKFQEFAGGLIHPLAMVSIPDGSGRMAVIEQHGQVRIIDARVAFCPSRFSTSGRKCQPCTISSTSADFWASPSIRNTARTASSTSPIRFRCAAKSSTGGCGGRTRTSCPSFNVMKNNANKADPNYERVISQIDWPQFNHNGHWIGFGPDNMLYISTGDGGYANDWGIGHDVATGNGQDLKSPHGKILRLDVDKADLIPADNPFVGRSDALPQTWALGLAQPLALLLRHGWRQGTLLR